MATANDAGWDQGVSQLLGTLKSCRANLTLLLLLSSVLATKSGSPPPPSHHDRLTSSGLSQQAY